MKQLTLLCAMALVSFMACQKENASTSTIMADNYLPLKVGNYWIYANSYVESDGKETFSKELDSVFVKKDTLINNQKYFIVESSNPEFFGVGIVRDSLHYIVSNYGTKLFSSENLTDTLQNLGIKDLEMFIKARYRKMINENNVESSVGTFNCLDSRINIILKESIDGNLAKYCHNYYAQDIGIIKRTASYLTSKSYQKANLIRYKVQ